MATRAAVSNAMTQGIAVATHVQDSFNWKGVAAAAVGSAVGYKLTGALNDVGAFGMLGQMGGQVARDTLSGFVGGMAAAATRGGRFTTEQVATDAFGNALGYSLATSDYSGASQQERFRASEINAQNSQAQRDRTAALYGLGSGTTAGDGSGWVPSGKSYRFGELGSGTYGLGTASIEPMAPMAAAADPASLRFNNIDPSSISYGDSWAKARPLWTSDALGRDIYSSGNVTPWGDLRPINGPAIGFPNPAVLPAGAATSAFSDAAGHLFYQVVAPGVNVMTAYDPTAVAPSIPEQATLDRVTITGKRSSGLDDVKLAAIDTAKWVVSADYATTGRGMVPDAVNGAMGLGGGVVDFLAYGEFNRMKAQGAIPINANYTPVSDLGRAVNQNGPGTVAVDTLKNMPGVRSYLAFNRGDNRTAFSTLAEDAIMLGGLPRMLTAFRGSAAADAVGASSALGNVADAAVGARDGVVIGPWSEGATNIIKDGVFTQCANGSCVSATGQILSDGSLTEQQLLSRIGEWSNPDALAAELNRANPEANWKSGYLASEADAVAVANRGQVGVVLQAQGAPAHMVTMEPITDAAGMYRVYDTGAGATYDVTTAWVKRFVAGGVWR